MTRLFSLGTVWPPVGPESAVLCFGALLDAGLSPESCPKPPRRCSSFSSELGPDPGAFCFFGLSTSESRLRLTFECSAMTISAVTACTAVLRRDNVGYIINEGAGLSRGHREACEQASTCQRPDHEQDCVGIVCTRSNLMPKL